jgi:glycosyltransferase involved in cell wall biosynthesis
MIEGEYTIVAGDFVTTGGMDAPNFALASYLARSGRTVHLVGYRVMEELRRNANVVFHRVPKPAGAYALGAPLLGGRGFLQAIAVAARRGAVVVNGGNCPFPGVNWVHYVHSAFTPVTAGDTWRQARIRALHRINMLTEHVALRSAKAIIANSERTRRDVIEKIGIAEDRITTVYYGVDATRFHSTSEDERLATRRSLGWREGVPHVVFVGALGDRRKGFDVLYEAWRLLCARGSWDAVLVVVGSGGELPVWRARAVADGLTGRVHFLGFRRDVPRVLMSSDALVAPTRYEAYGAGVHEALCCGLPALVSASAGVAERYPEHLRELLLDDVESPTVLAQRIRQWRERASEWREAVAPFAERLRARSWDDMAGDVMSVCDNL